MNKCYGWDEELNICLIYGIYCTATKDIKCYHENEEELKQALKNCEE